jgi:hypothetical protein
MSETLHSSEYDSTDCKALSIVLSDVAIMIGQVQLQNFRRRIRHDLPNGKGFCMSMGSSCCQEAVTKETLAPKLWKLRAMYRIGLRLQAFVHKIVLTGIVEVHIAGYTG